MAHDRMLVAGIGNIFLSDDAFGVEVVRLLSTRRLPNGVVVRDFGVRALHLACDLLDGGYRLLVLVDALSRGHEAGVVEVFEPHLDDRFEGVADAHGLDPASVLRMVQTMGGAIPPTVVVGCEPASLDPGIGLSPPVSAALDDAVSAVITLLENGGPCRVPGDSRTDLRAAGRRTASRRRRGVESAAGDQHRPPRG